MAEILKEWLTERLRRPIKWEAEAFGEMMKNGYIIASVLLSYNVINEEKHFLIRSSNAPEDIRNNWSYLSEWLRELKVHLNANDLYSLQEGKGTALLRLFYQLFLHLDRRDRTNFIKRERKMASNLVDKMKNRFKVEKVEEKEESFVDELSRPLLNEKQFIDWQRKKTEQVKETYNYIRLKYSKMLQRIEESKTPFQYEPAMAQQLTNKNKKEMEQFELRYPCKFQNYTYEELVELDEKAAERKREIIDTKWAKEYMENLHSRLRRRSDSKEFQKQVRNALSGSLWDLTVAEEEDKLDKELAKKVMKLSEFEKQMCTKIMETKQQARNLVQNRIQAEREFTDQREQHFNQFLDNIKDQINLENSEIDFEKNRQNMLHKKLYAEKIRRKRQHYYKICYETMLSIVDYATKYAYFTRLTGDDIPNHFIHEWKSLYFKHQPIFDILDPMEDILKEELEENDAPEEEEIVRLELNRQEALNDTEFEEYHNYSYPWSLDLLMPNYDPESEERKYEDLGIRILGHIVYTLLDIKYPYPPSRPQAALPQYSAKAVLRGLPDRSITVAMQSLLNMRKIHVVRLESAINFCLKRFKIEMIGCTDIELSFDKMIATASEEEDKELIRLMKVDEEISSKNSELILLSQILGTIPTNCKLIQTPKTIPEEDIKLSTSAELGKYAYETLNFGDTLTDHLLSAMIVEYLKEQNDINGFVIINYPNTYREAQILEETFSGRAPPDDESLDDRDDIYLEQSIAKHRKKEFDQYKEIRVSKLVDDPHKKQAENPFESYFNCYIKLKETEDILQEVVIWDLTNDNSDLIDRFYAVLGINYSMYYEMIDKDFLAQICTYIIGDCLMPLKSYDSLFGENVLSLLDFPNPDDKRARSKIAKPEMVNGKSKEKIRRSSKTSKVSINNELETGIRLDSIENTLPCDSIVVAEDVENERIESIVSLNSEIAISPGEKEWDYGEIPIAPTIAVALATCWEEIEKTYISDVKQLFFSKRLQMNSLIPYARFTKDKMEQIMTLPSIKQDIVSRFQKDYNEFENDWRFIHLTKNEWHCRVKDLQNRLYNICDERKLYAENQRHALICENWAVEELTTMVNTYISCIQTELNRSMLTFQILHDFYFAMIKQMPPNDRISSKDLTKIIRESDETSGSRRGGEDKVFRQLKAAFQDLQLKNIEIDYSNNPFNLILENNLKFAVKTIKEINDHYRSLISREYNEVIKISPPIKRKDDNASEVSINLEDIFKTNALKCIDEWLMGINGEMYRANLRMQVLQHKCFRDMKLFNDHIYKTFMEVQNDISAFYVNEIKSVDRLCKYLQIAIENGRKISESLIIERDTLIIDPNLLQFAPPEFLSTREEDKEMATEYQFKVGQLAKLRSLFKTVAPTGIALQQAFVYVLQDFVFFGKESCDGHLVPETWKRIDPEQVPKLVSMLYGETACIDWREFLIHCLNINFPTVEGLLDLRKRFRCKDLASTEHISRDDFITDCFWFEEDIDKEDKNVQLKKNLTKHFLFELYESSEDKINYSAFLLAFCKNVNPIEGFATALAMAVGKKVCFSIDECEEVVCKLIKQKQYKDACLACALQCANQLLDKVLVAVVKICEGTSVIELEYTEALPDKTEKKGKGGKDKKTGVSQSARLPKSQKSPSRSKTVQSETDVKKTFICKPCEGELEALEKKPQEKAESIEDTNEPQENPNLAYVVSQATIWNVLKVCIPGHFQLIPEETSYELQVKSVLKHLEIDTDNGDIYVCKFVSDPIICKLLHKVKKFTALNLAEELRKFCS